MKMNNVEVTIARLLARRYEGGSISIFFGERRPDSLIICIYTCFSVRLRRRRRRRRRRGGRRRRRRHMQRPSLPVFVSNNFVSG